MTVSLLHFMLELQHIVSFVEINNGT